MEEHKMSNNPSNPEGGWQGLNDDKYNADERNRQIAERDERLGFGQICNDGSTTPGGLRVELAKLVATSKEAQQIVLDSGGELPTVPKEFRLSQGEIGTVVADEQGQWTASVTSNGQTFAFRSESRDAALMACERALEKARGPQFKELTEGQRLNIIRLCQNHDVLTALGSYLFFVLGDVVTDKHPDEIASTPEFLPVMNQAVYFCWRHANNAYHATPEAEASLAKFAGDRPLTLGLCNAWFLAYEESTEQRRAAQADAPETEPFVTQDDLERLSDTDLAKLRTAALQMRARRVREVLGR
jgi:hypothetical protein